MRAKVPVIILNISPGEAIDYHVFNNLKDRTKMTGEWLASCSACSVPEIANVFKRTGVKFQQITGMLYNDDECWDEVNEWVEAARVAHIMAYNRMGCIGHYYSGMLDIYSDLTQHYGTFGGHIELLEMEDLFFVYQGYFLCRNNEVVADKYILPVFFILVTNPA